ncbi:FecR family protein [Daejeonella lutea]|uniref:FecR family protein n=1 Tax=Daejeonella lutea TaxID=572036 RepID=A0A1T5BRW5_9SPHI|nr:FecR domain-containing protein [Daejeonella lutea]SKB49869.1 FecR family protein [Daejeonella lutea]
MNTNQERAKQLISRYRNLSQQDSIWLSNYLESADPDEFREFLEPHPEGEKSPEADLLDKAVSAKLLSSIHKRISSESGNPPVRKWPAALLAIAASLLLLLTIGIFYRNNLSIITGQEQLSAATSWGERKTIILPDGTKVWLAPGTKLNYPDRFQGNIRPVELEGEAFFEVSHDKEHPFIISSGEVKTTVLGTSFNVSAYQKEQTIKVAVLSGKVRVEASEQGKTQRQILLPNQQAILEKSSKSLSMQSYPQSSKYLLQREGRFEYQGAPIQDLAAEMERQFNVRFVVDESLKGKAFYGSLDMNNKPAEILKKLSLVMETTWEEKAGVYFINP